MIRGSEQARPAAVEAVIFDWAGTVMDFGSRAPATVFVEVFRRQGVAITMAEARAPMGLQKRAHIAVIAADAGVRERWRQVHGRAPEEADIDAMYAAFVPLQLECLSAHATLVPGTLETVAALRRRGAKIGSTTGYSSDMMRINLADAARQGFQPDCTVCAGDVPQGRPSPQMCLQNVILLGAGHVAACVKVDDTVPGIAEGLNAGMWTVAVAVSGNEVGLGLDEWQALPAAGQATRRRAATDKLLRAGAHYVIDGVADLMPCIDDIGQRLRGGERP